MKMFNKILFVLLITYYTEIASLTVTSQIYIDIKYHRKPLGRIVFGLFGNDAPKTVENFRHICLKGIDGKTYVNSTFHRVIDRFIIQGGDIVSNDGIGSISIYGKYFDDENLLIKHTESGYLGMANRGPNTNGCQFYITTIIAPWLDGKHTIFGKVLKGFEYVHKIEKVPTDTDDVPLKPVYITKCGEIPTKKSFVIDDYSYGLWSWLIAAGPAIVMTFGILSIFHYFIRKLNMYC